MDKKPCVDTVRCDGMCMTHPVLHAQALSTDYLSVIALAQPRTDMGNNTAVRCFNIPSGLS